MSVVDDFQRASLLTGRADAADIIRELNAQLRDFNEDEAILDPRRLRLVVLVDGLVRIRQRAAVDGQYKTVTTRAAPAVIGELEYLDPPLGLGTFEVITSTRARAWLVTHEHLNHLRDQRREAFDALLADLGRIEAKKLAESMKRTSEQSALSKKHVDLLRLHVPDTGLSFNIARDNAELEEEHVEKKVVIFFSDVVDFSLLSGSLSEEPETLARVTNDFLRVQAKIIHGEEGEIDKFIGDEVMAFWIISPDNEAVERNTCSRALAAAQRAVNAVAAVKDPKTGAGLQIRVGLHVGKAHVGNYGSDERSNFSLIGPAVNFAARLEQARGGELGAIRVSNDFFNRLGADEQTQLPGSADLQVKNDKVIMRHSGTM